MSRIASLRRLRARFRALLARLGYDGYEPARHYMRGPGPRAKAKSGSRIGGPRDEAMPAAADGRGAAAPGEREADGVVRQPHNSIR